jgi:outer membrane receptor protein involved in Fe transport
MNDFIPKPIEVEEMMVVLLRNLPARLAAAPEQNEFKADQAASGKYTQPLVDTPQTIIVIKKELIEQQGAVTLTEALRNTPGVGTFFLGENGNTNTGDAIYMRGFDSSGSLFVDGIRDIGSVSRDVFNIEQIDVLKGPAGTDTGRGAPTGSINLATKQPLLKNIGEASLVAGSAERKRGTADVNRVLDRRRGIAMRLNVLDQDNGNPARDDGQGQALGGGALDCLRPARPDPALPRLPARQAGQPPGRRRADHRPARLQQPGSEAPVAGRARRRSIRKTSTARCRTSTACGPTCSPPSSTTNSATACA